MSEPLTADEQHQQIRKAAEALVEAYDSYAISTSMIVLKRQVDALRATLDQANPTQKNRLWAIYDRNGVRCSGWYLRRRDALASTNYWRNDYYKRGYRCHRGEESDAKA